VIPAIDGRKIKLLLVSIRLNYSVSA